MDKGRVGPNGEGEIWRAREGGSTLGHYQIAPLLLEFMHRHLLDGVKF